MATNQALAHTWANASAADSGKASNMFFEDGVIYSYGRHFPIARRVFDAHGAHVVTLMTTATYSLTTARHISHVQRAIWGRSIGVSNVRANSKSEHVANLDDMRERAEAAVLSATKRRRADLADQDINEARRIAHEARDYAAAFGLKVARQLAQFPDVDGPALADTVAAIKARAEKRRKAQAAADRRAEKKRLEREAAERAEAAAYLADWRTDPTMRTIGTLYRLPVALRLTDDREHVQTSHGATVETRHALVLWRALQSGRDIVGAHVGPYQIRGADSDHIQIGCHRIPCAEIRAIAAQLGV